MRWSDLRRILGLGVGLGLAWAGPASGVEYRLLVANVQETGFTAYLDRAALSRGAGEGRIPRLEASLDGGRFPFGVLLHDRPVRPGDGALARALGPGEVRLVPGVAADGVQWVEVRWDGRPGERSVWVITPSTEGYQEAYHLALGAGGPLHYFIPYSGVTARRPASAFTLPRAFMVAHGEQGDLWDKHLGPATDLSRGLAAIVGTSEAPLHSDTVYLVVQHPAQARTFKAVVGWRPRPSQDFRIQGGGGVER